MDIRERIKFIIDELCSWDPERMSDESYEGYKNIVINSLIELFNEKILEETVKEHDKLLDGLTVSITNALQGMKKKD